jgi:hypothetical protein
VARNRNTRSLNLSSSNPTWLSSLKTKVTEGNRIATLGQTTGPALHGFAEFRSLGR